MKFYFAVFVLILSISYSCNMASPLTNPHDETQLVLPKKLDDLDSKYDSKTLRHRSKRGTIWDFFQKIGITSNLISEQYKDTRDSFAEVYNLINGQFSDPGPEKPTKRPSSTTESSRVSSEETSESTETTTEAFSISRYELGRVLGRNFRGLLRLQDLEFRDAMNASYYNVQEYKAEANKQFANSLAVEKKNAIKALAG